MYHVYFYLFLMIWAFIGPQAIHIQGLHVAIVGNQMDRYGQNMMKEAFSHFLNVIYGFYA